MVTYERFGNDVDVHLSCALDLPVEEGFFARSGDGVGGVIAAAA